MDENNDNSNDGMQEGDESSLEAAAAQDENVDHEGGGGGTGRHQQESEVNDNENNIHESHNSDVGGVANEFHPQPHDGNNHHAVIRNAMVMDDHLDDMTDSSDSEDDDSDDEDDDEDEEEDTHLEWEHKKTNESIQAFLLAASTTTTSPLSRRQSPSHPTSKLYDFYIQSDDVAMEIGEALLAKTTTTTTNHNTPLKLTFHIKKRLTARGAQAIVQGLQHYFSNHDHQSSLSPPHAPPVILLQLTLEQVRLQTMSPAFRYMVLAIIPIIAVPTELMLMARCSNRDAHQIGSTLIEAARKNNVAHGYLIKLQITMGLSVTEVGATRLCRGLAHSKVQKLELRGYVDDRFEQQQQSPRVMQLLFLQAISTVRELVLEYPLSNDDATLLGTALMNGNGQLSLLDIRLQRALTVPSAMTLAQGIQRSHSIENLYVSGAAQEEHTISSEVGEVLYQGIQHLQTLCHLTIGIGMQATASLGHCLTAPRLSSLQVFPYESSFTPNILQALPNASQLSMLRFGPLLDAHDVRLLCQALPHLTSLAKLYIRGQLICDEGVALMIECNNNGEFVTYEAVKSRRVRAAGAELLMMAIANHPCLEELDLDGSIDLAFLGLDMIGHWLPRLKLKRLCLNRLLDNCDDEDDDENVRRAHKKAVQALVEGFRYNYHLEQYRVSSFLHLSVAQKNEIAYYLELNPAGRYLLGLDHDHAVATSVWCHVLARWKDNANMFYGLLREQPTLLAAASLEGCDASAGSKRRRES